MQIKKSYVNDNEIQNQEELITLDTISPTWANRLEESKLYPVDDCNYILNLKMLQNV